MQPHSLRSPLEAALYYLSLGWSPIPLHPPAARVKRPGKQPIGPWERWQDERPTDADLHDAWARTPDANVGVCLGPVSGLLGVDVDGDAGHDLLMDWAGGPANVAATLAFLTPGGSRLLYAIPPGVSVPTRSFAADGREAVRILSRGSQTVMPPSRLAAGDYAWIDGCAPWEITAAAAPGWLLSRLQGGAGGGSTPPRPEGDGQGGASAPPPLPDRPGRVERARLYLRTCDEAVTHQRGSDQTLKVADKVAVGFGLSDEDALDALWEEWNGRCKPPWTRRDLARKIAEARKTSMRSVGYLLDEPRKIDAPMPTPPAAVFPVSMPPIPVPRETGNRKQPPTSFATAADLIAAAAELRWAWDGWVPLGLLTALAAEPGVGKTRLCGDLARRIYHGLPWPDGQLSTFPRGSPTLWVASDNQHPQLVAICQEMALPPEAMVFSTAREEPFGGTSLDQPEDLARLEAAIRVVKPALVFIDTTLNATDRGCTKPEDAKAFFVPLMEIARRTGAPILCVTHLNAAGKALGLRIRGQCRVVWHLSMPDPAQEDRRKLWVEKSLAKYPKPLGVTMKDDRNDYDDDPPAEPGQEPGERRPARFEELVGWLRETLTHGGRRVATLRDEAEDRGFSSKTLYRARREGVVEEYEEAGRTFWRLA